MFITINNGNTIIRTDRIAAVSGVVSGRARSINIHLSNSVPLHVPYGEDVERWESDLRALIKRAESEEF